MTLAIDPWHDGRTLRVVEAWIVGMADDAGGTVLRRTDSGGLQPLAVHATCHEEVGAVGKSDDSGLGWLGGGFPADGKMCAE